MNKFISLTTSLIIARTFFRRAPGILLGLSVFIAVTIAQAAAQEAADFDRDWPDMNRWVNLRNELRNGEDWFNGFHQPRKFTHREATIGRYFGEDAAEPGEAFDVDDYVWDDDLDDYRWEDELSPYDERDDIFPDESLDSPDVFDYELPHRNTYFRGDDSFDYDYYTDDYWDAFDDLDEWMKWSTWRNSRKAALRNRLHGGGFRSR